MTRALIASAAVAALCVAASACHPVRKRGANKVTLAVLPAESAKFPDAAQAITTSLSEADVPGVDDRQVAGVSLEVAQLSVECIDHTVVCYTKVGKSLDANQILFAQIAAVDRKRLRVTVTLFDVDARKPHSARRVFANEAEARAKIGELVSEATR